MPYFLTSKFREIMEQSEQANQGQDEENAQKQNPTAMYKSEFLLAKIMQ